MGVDQVTVLVNPNSWVPEEDDTIDLAKQWTEALHPRDKDGQFTKSETRAWLLRHPVDFQNVVDTWDEATPGEKEAGEVWYDHAHKLAQALAKRYNVSVTTAAGLLATYSPQTPWGANVREAAEVLREGHGVGGPGAHIYWHKDSKTPNTFEEREGIMAPGGTKIRADRILAGEDPEEVFAGRNKSGNLNPKSLKIRAFSELIANGTQLDPEHPKVVIDRHAAGVARGVRLNDDDYNIDGPSGSAKKFAVYTSAYNKAAKVISAKEGRTITPEQVQAATWLTRQRLNGALVSQVGKTRKTLGQQDNQKIASYVEQYLPEAKMYLPKTGYADLSHDVSRQLRSPDGRWVATFNESDMRAGYDLTVDGQHAGAIGWWKVTKDGATKDVISSVTVLPEFQRRGLATWAYRVAKKTNPGLKHDTNHQSAAGKAWAKSLSAMDLSAPGPGVLKSPRPEQRVSIQPGADSDTTVRLIAAALGESRRVTTLQSDLEFEVATLRDLLAPYGVSEAASRLAINLTYTRGGYARGTEHSPNARLHGGTAEGQIVHVRDNEVYMRAAYLANAAKRMQRSMDDGKTEREALHKEQPHYRAHERARRGRLDAAAQVEQAAAHVGYTDARGTLLGWYRNPLLNNDAECLAADGHNFYAEEGTVLGLPGSVHSGCGCYAGPPHEGAGLVNDAVSNLVVLRRTRPTFKLKTGKRRYA
jgi:hypothetical protein